jgi:hypothetical protein
MLLRLRDLGQPHLTYHEPFESHVELAQPYFGPVHLSEQSGRGNAFFWPSIVRVGPEAARLRDQSEGTETLSGLTSPKRYLFDVAALNQQWRFQRASDDNERPEEPAQLDNLVRNYVGPCGDVRRQVEEDKSLYRRLFEGHKIDLTDYPQRLSFSRSSMFTFMIAEIVWHAMTQINNPQIRANRGEADTPRRLERIVLTIPTAMPIIEQRIFRSRAAGAIKLLWDMLGWTEQVPTGVLLPEIEISLDEASCVQLVYLFGEIHQHFSGNANAYFDLVGRARGRLSDSGSSVSSLPERSLRVASIDVGGGTTDLMITTYFVEDGKALVPYQNFREGFRVAGDDLLRDVIERCILPELERRLVESGQPGAREFLNNRFGSDRVDMKEGDRHRRRQFVTRVFRSAAIAIIHAAEKADWVEEERPLKRTLAELALAGGGALYDRAASRAIQYVDQAARASGAEGFSVLDTELEISLRDVRAGVEATFGDIFANIAEMVNHLDCDVVLFAGRPSRLPAVVELFINKLAVAPNRVVALGSYQTGRWYPFSSLDRFTIADPKTATVTGAMLAQFAQKDIENFTVMTKRLQHRSCAKEIGELEINGQLRDDKVLFRFDSNRPPGIPETASLSYWNPVKLGYRQIPFERWVATPLYYLRFTGPDAGRIAKPVCVGLERETPEQMVDFEDSQFPINEAVKETIRIVSASDPNGATLDRLFALELNTMGTLDGYWLDTGLLHVGG